MNHFFDWGDDEDKAVYVGLEMAEERSAHAKAMNKSCYGRGFGLKQDECGACVVKAVCEVKSKVSKLEHEEHLRNVLEASDHAKAMREAKPSAIEQTLKERGDRYGNFDSHAVITQRIKDVMQNKLTNVFTNWDSLDASQKEALEMIAHKIARILNGDPNYSDSWHDIAGYATLVEGQLSK